MIIDNELITYLEELSRLKLDEEEKEKAKDSLSKIIGYIDVLSKLDTENEKEMSHTFEFSNVFREDVLKTSYKSEEILKNAPDKKDGCFKVPKTVE